MDFDSELWCILQCSSSSLYVKFNEAYYKNIWFGVEGVFNIVKNFSIYFFQNVLVSQKNAFFIWIIIVKNFLHD